jgi:hypothetical protein
MTDSGFHVLNATGQTLTDIEGTVPVTVARTSGPPRPVGVTRRRVGPRLWGGRGPLTL